MLAEPWVGQMLIYGYLGLLSLIWMLMVVAVSKWGRKWEISEPQNEPTVVSSVSICIPARNEALNIGSCIEAALASDWPELEVVVVDDRSDDGTGDVARKAADGDPRLRRSASSMALCRALGVPVATSGHGAELVAGRWSGAHAIPKRHMMRKECTKTRERGERACRE